MESTIRVKYSYLVFSLGFPFPRIAQPFRFDDSTELRPSSIKNQIQGPDSKHWPEWVGSLQWEALSRHRLVLAAWQQTDKPEVLDGENEALNSKVLGIFRILPLVAALTPPFEEAFLISGQGTLTNGELKAEDVRSFSKVKAWTRSYYNEHHWDEFSAWATNEITQSGLLNAWRDCYTNFCKLLVVGTANRQILECFRSFEEAMKSTQLEFKMPNLVRAMECIIDCWGYQEFSKRVLHLTGTPPRGLPFAVSTNSQSLLEDLYQLRNDCSHGKPFAYSIEKKTRKAPESTLVARYEFIAEWASRKILNDSFVNPTILAATIDRDTLVAAWKGGTIKP